MAALPAAVSGVTVGVADVPAHGRRPVLRSSQRNVHAGQKRTAVLMQAEALLCSALQPLQPVQHTCRALMQAALSLLCTHWDMSYTLA